MPTPNIQWDQPNNQGVQWDTPPSSGLDTALQYAKTAGNAPATAITNILGAPTDLTNMLLRANSRFANGINSLLGLQQHPAPQIPIGGADAIQKAASRLWGLPQNEMFGANNPQSEGQQLLSGGQTAILGGGKPGAVSFAAQQAVGALGGNEDAQAIAAVAAPSAASGVANLPKRGIQAALTSPESASRVATNEAASGSPGTLGMVGNGLSQSLESILAKMPGSVQNVYDAINAIHDGIRQRWNGIMNNISSVKGPAVAGNSVAEGALARNEQTKALTSQLYDNAAKRVEPGTEVNMQPLITAAEETTKAIPDAPRMTEALKGTTQNWVQAQHGALWGDILDYGIRQYEKENGPLTEVTAADMTGRLGINPDAVMVQRDPTNGTSIYKLGDSHYLIDPSNDAVPITKITGTGDAKAMLAMQPPKYTKDEVTQIPDGRIIPNHVWDPIESDIRQNPVLPYNTADIIHRKLGQELNDPSLLSRGIDDGIVKQIWGGSKEGIDNALEGTQAGRLLDLANNFYMQKNAERKLVNPILTSAQSGGPEAIFNAAVNDAGTSGSGTRFRELFANAGAEGRPTIVATLLDHMGKFDENMTTHTQDAKWSPSTFITNWGKLNPDAKNAVASQLGPEYAANLDALDKWNSDVIRGRSMYGNPSQTGSATAHIATATSAAVSAMNLLAGVGTGNHTQIVGGATGLGLVGGTLIGAKLTASLFTNPNFVRWLVSATKAPPNALPAVITQLAAIGRQTGNQDMIQAAQMMQSQQQGQNNGNTQ